MCIQTTYIYRACEHELRDHIQHCWRYYGPAAACRLYHPREKVDGHCHECKRKIAIHNALQEKVRAREREAEREKERVAERRELEKRRAAGTGTGTLTVRNW
ncbi:hypothetical protein MMC30_008907 [Trapelia coarctata]|nr:hypothetical protein [Trapelia coarctata]